MQTRFDGPDFGWRISKSLWYHDARPDLLVVSTITRKRQEEGDRRQERQGKTLFQSSPFAFHHLDCGEDRLASKASA
jgi:hypothetical protein